MGLASVIYNSLCISPQSESRFLLRDSPIPKSTRFALNFLHIPRIQSGSRSCRLSPIPSSRGTERPGDSPSTSSENRQFSSVLEESPSHTCDSFDNLDETKENSGYASSVRNVALWVSSSCGHLFRSLLVAFGIGLGFKDGVGKASEFFAGKAQEHVLNSSSDQPPFFDGTTRLYTSFRCPYAQRVWITRNYKGLQDDIKLVPLNLQDRPTWYKEKVYPENKVPALEHNGKVIGESLDLIKYVDTNFNGPSLWPQDGNKRNYGEEVLVYVNTFTASVYSSFKSDPPKEVGSQFDYLENALKKFDDGPFLLGEFSLVDIAYIPFVERFQIFLSEVWKYDPTQGRPKLTAWIEELNKIDAYKDTKVNPNELVDNYKKRFLAQE